MQSKVIAKLIEGRALGFNCVVTGFRSQIVLG
jgi:hypothetical protein